MSRVYLEEHDNQCPYKIMQCKCGDRFPRHQLDIHNAQACKFRDVDCPFKNIGCDKVIKACDLQSHIVEDASAHLLLAVNRMLEHQNVIKNLNARVKSLEAENKEMKQTLEDHVTKTNNDLSTCRKEFRKINSR